MALEDPKILGSWVHERILGSGGFGIVSLWKNKQDEFTVAIKKCRPGVDSLLTPLYKERWSKEVEMMARLAHPNIVASLKIPEPLKALKSELPILCMEFCAKGDMRHILIKPENSSGLQENDVRDFIYDIKSAIQYLHSMKITHRDLKPENIVLKQTENRILYKLIDLGYAKELDASSICHSFVGTLQYLAPELLQGKSYTSSVDYWSLGLVSFEVITGTRPFLPHLDTVNWMTYVQKKTSDDICVYQTLDDKIIYAQEIFENNYISSTLKYLLEGWLKMILEWEPSKRGRDENNKIILFDKIDQILNKKILTIFSMTNYIILSYEIDESTQILTLQKWVERDTNLNIDHQELIKDDGTLIEIKTLVLESFPEMKPGDIHLYVFDKYSLIMPKVPPKIPSLVTKMMEDPKVLLTLYHIKRIWSDSVFYLRHEMDLYKNFLLGYRAKMLNLFKKNSILQVNWVNLNINISQLEELLKLYEESENFDKKQAIKYNFDSNLILNSWSSKVSEETTNISVLKDLLTKLKQKCDSVNQKIYELQKSPYIMFKEQDVLKEFYEKGLNLLDKLRALMKDNKSLKKNSVEMAHIIYKCFKHRDQIIHDEIFASKLQKLINIQNDIEKISIPISTAINHIESLKTNIRRAQIERQKQIWDLLNNPKLTSNKNLLDKENNLTQNSDTEKRKHISQHQSKYQFSNEHTIIKKLDCLNKIMESKINDSNKIILQNKEYRHKIEESIENARRLQKLICKDDLFEWDALKK